MIFTAFKIIMHYYFDIKLTQQPSVETPSIRHFVNMFLYTTRYFNISLI